MKINKYKEIEIEIKIEIKIEINQFKSNCKYQSENHNKRKSKL